MNDSSPFPTRSRRIYRRAYLCELLTVSPVWITRHVKNGTFPSPIKLGPNSVGWLVEEVEDWIAARAAEREVTQ